MVRFNEKAAAAARQKGSNEASAGSWELIAWGDLEAGGSVPSSVHSTAKNGVKSLHASASAFLVVNEENIFGVWGEPASGGGNIPLELTHERPVASVEELSRSFVIIYTSGEALVYGQNGATLYSSVPAASVKDGTVKKLEGGTSVVRGIGNGNFFLGALGTPCIPDNWSEWGLCNGSCLGNRKRERIIAFEEQNGGSCTTNVIGLESCRGPLATDEECARLVAAEESETGSSNSSPPSLTIEAILGIVFAGVGIVLVIGVVLYLWTS